MNRVIRKSLMRITMGGKMLNRDQYITFLDRVGKNEFRCPTCHKIFTIKQYVQLDKFVHYLSSNDIVEIEKIKEMSKGLELVYYRRISESEREIVETVTDKIIIP